MTALQDAAAMLHDLKHHPDSFSVRDIDIQSSFAKLVRGRRGLSEDAAYAAYERSVQRENSHAALVGDAPIQLLGRSGFSSLIRTMELERERPIDIRRAARTIH